MTNCDENTDARTLVSVTAATNFNDNTATFAARLSALFVVGLVTNCFYVDMDIESEDVGTLVLHGPLDALRAQGLSRMQRPHGIRE